MEVTVVVGRVVVVLVVQFLIARTPGALLLEARAILAEDAEIVIRILEVIFGLDTVARELGIARHALVFLQQLGSIATLAIVLPVARLSAAEVSSPALPTTAASAAALSIIDQIHRPYAVSLAPCSRIGQGCANAQPLTLSFRSAQRSA